MRRKKLWQIWERVKHFSGTISPEENCLSPPNLNLTLTRTQSLTLTGGNFPRRQMSGHHLCLYLKNKQNYPPCVFYRKVVSWVIYGAPVNTKSKISQRFYHPRVGLKKWATLYFVKLRLWERGIQKLKHAESMMLLKYDYINFIIL